MLTDPLISHYPRESKCSEAPCYLRSGANELIASAIRQFSFFHLAIQQLQVLSKYKGRLVFEAHSIDGQLAYTHQIKEGVNGIICDNEMRETELLERAAEHRKEIETVVAQSRSALLHRPGILNAEFFTGVSCCVIVSPQLMDVVSLKFRLLVDAQSYLSEALRIESETTFEGIGPRETANIEGNEVIGIAEGGTMSEQGLKEAAILHSVLYLHIVKAEVV